MPHILKYREDDNRWALWSTISDGLITDWLTHEEMKKELKLRDWGIGRILRELGDRFGVLERFKDGKWGCYVPNDIGISATGDTPEDVLLELLFRLGNLSVEDYRKLMD